MQRVIVDRTGRDTADLGRVVYDACQGPAIESWMLDRGTGKCDCMFFFFFSSRRRHTRLQGDWSSDVCSSDLALAGAASEGTNVGGSNSLNIIDVDSHATVGDGASLTATAGDIVVKASNSNEIGRASCRERV